MSVEGVRHRLNRPSPTEIKAEIRAGTGKVQARRLASTTRTIRSGRGARRRADNIHSHPLRHDWDQTSLPDQERLRARSRCALGAEKAIATTIGREHRQDQVMVGLQPLSSKVCLLRAYRTRNRDLRALASLPSHPAGTRRRRYSSGSRVRLGKGATSNLSNPFLKIVKSILLHHHRSTAEALVPTCFKPRDSGGWVSSNLSQAPTLLHSFRRLKRRSRSKQTTTGHLWNANP